MAKRRTSALDAPFPGFLPNGGMAQGCAYPGCKDSGDYRAPTAPDKPGQFQWLCLDHVRAFNAGWNFFEGWDRDEIEAQCRRDQHWDLPTWKLGHRLAGGYLDQDSLNDPLGVVPEAARRRRQAQKPRSRQQSHEEREALTVLGLEVDVSFEEIKQRYKDLAKRLHPDSNKQKNKHTGHEERLKKVNQAYATLKKLHSNTVQV